MTLLTFTALRSTIFPRLGELVGWAIYKGVDKQRWGRLVRRWLRGGSIVQEGQVGAGRG
jgi:(2Fe-2S) ferredoxin